MRLTVAAIPLWFQLPLIDDCFSRVQQALTSVGSGLSRDSHAHHAMQLRAVAVARHQAMEMTAALTSGDRYLSLSREHLLARIEEKARNCSIIAASNPTSVNTAPK